MEAVYHHNCPLEFKQMTTNREKRRPIDESKVEAFQRFCNWFESECNYRMYYVQELYEKMSENRDD